jgi:hypothetical protein
MKEVIMSVKGWKLFLGIVTLNLLVIFLSQIILINDIVFFNTYSEQLTYDRSMELFQQMRSYSWVSYILVTVFLLLKFTAVAVLLYIGVYFNDLHRELPLGIIFKVVIISESIFVTASILKLLWFAFFAGNYTLDDISFFYPLSLINLFNRSEVATYWVYPLQTVNLFQFLYVLLLAFGLSKAGSVKKSLAEKVVLSTYVPAIAVWITLIMFFTIDAMP